MPTAPSQRVAVGALAVGTAVMSGIYAPQPLLAEIAREFGRSAFEANLVVSTTTLGIALGVFPMAAMAARFGRGRSVALGLALATLLTGLTATVSGWEMLVAVRFLAGIASSAVLVAAIAWTTAVVDRAAAARVAAMYVAGTTAGGILGRVLSGVVADAFGWRWGLLAVDAALLIAAVIGLALIARAARRPEPHPSPASTPVAFGSRTLRWRLYALGGLGTAVFVGVFNALTFRMTEPPFSLSLTAVSLLFLTYLAGTFSSMRTGAIIERWGARGAAALGTVLALVGVLITLASTLWAVIVGLLVLAAGFFIVHATASGLVPRMIATPTTGSAWYTLFYYGGSSVGALAMGLAWDIARWPAVAGLGGVLCVAMIAVASSLPSRRASLLP
ncbi:MFS transporter [Microbacterium jiangjiandongii]|uniref:MFS transporter n=1 Tax=Microbacterium jiangjiandongii TaxID=3049071 RepID=UPI00214AE49B|nr:MFS transporter [Microbacterium sp. zg.Y843]MCR2816543.1 MFS transporter [Microbacterium sp. zg.Y843]